jgi:Na+/proline symporter
LQEIIVFAGGGLAVSFLIPVSLAMYWPRYNRQGALAAMLGGAATYMSLYAAGKLMFRYGMADSNTFLSPLELHPLIWGLAASLLCGVLVTLITARPPEHLTQRFFLGKHLPSTTAPRAGERQ